MIVTELAALPGIRPICLPDEKREVKTGYIGDLLSWVMGKAPADAVWMTIMSNANICAVAALADVACILLVEGVTVGESVLALAQEKGINLLSTEMDAFTVACMLKGMLL